MNNILVAGATGNLGNRICRELIRRGAVVTALVRSSTDAEKVESLEKLGAKIVKADLSSPAELVSACQGMDCVVSSLAGLRDVIVDLQSRILDAALMAGVPKFIPSDFCTDYTDLVPGENRNFDLRREFRAYADSTSIKLSSVFNGAFADILMYNTPVLNLKDRSIGYWGENADWKLDFTSMDNTAAFTAQVALDNEAPRDLPIASFQVSAKDLQHYAKEITGQDFRMQQMGSLEDFAAYIKKQRADDPAGENELYSKWQQSQYMYCMFKTHHKHMANDRYEGLEWVGAKDFLKTFVR